MLCVRPEKEKIPIQPHMLDIFDSIVKSISLEIGCNYIKDGMIYSVTLHPVHSPVITPL